MFNELYDSYGYKQPEAFVSLQLQRKLPYPKPTRVPQEFTEIESFFSEYGQPTGDMVSPVIGEVEAQATNENNGGEVTYTTIQLFDNNGENLYDLNFTDIELSDGDSYGDFINFVVDSFSQLGQLIINGQNLNDGMFVMDIYDKYGTVESHITYTSSGTSTTQAFVMNDDLSVYNKAEVFYGDMCLACIGILEI